MTANFSGFIYSFDKSFKQITHYGLVLPSMPIIIKPNSKYSSLYFLTYALPFIFYCSLCG